MREVSPLHAWPHPGSRSNRGPWPRRASDRVSHVEGDTERFLSFEEAGGVFGESVSLADLSVAVLIPCLNEEHAIGTVVTEFARALPTARVIVYDNGSEDRTVDVARDAGAIVRLESRRGKGNVVRRMFADVE